MTESEFAALLGGPAPTATPTGTSFSERLGPQIPSIDILDTTAQTRAVVNQDENAEFIKRNSIGLPIDLSKEASSWIKFRAAALPNEQDRLSYLNRELREAFPEFYGRDMPARLTDTGDILMRVPDESGKAVEIPLNKPGITGSDVTALAAHAPETAAALAGAVFAKRLPMGERFPKLAASVYSSVAAPIAGAAEDAISRGTSGVEIQPGEIAGRRATEVPINLAMDAGFVGLHTLGRKLISPFAVTKPGEIGHELREGAQHYKDEFGMDFPMTVGEITQSPLVLRTEAAMARLPGASKTMEESKQAKKEFFETAQEKIAGAKRADIPTEQEVGEQAVGALRRKLEPLQSSVTSQREALFDALSSRLEQRMDELTGEAQQVFTERVGAGVRAKALGMWDTLQEQAAQKYEELYAMAGGTEKVLSAPAAAKEAREFLKKLPSKKITSAEEGRAFDAYGNPISKSVDVTRTERFDSVIPKQVIAVLDDLTELKGAKVSLKDLVGARSALDDLIAKDRGGLPDVKLRELTGARGLFTKAINEAAESSKDPALASTWKGINDWYATQVKKFDPATIQKLFVKSDKPGHVLDEDIVRNLKPSEYLQLKEFLGPTSSEFRVLRRSVVDQMMSGARQPGGRIDGKAFQRDLVNLWRDKRAIYDDIFPKGETERLTGIAQVLSEVPKEGTALPSSVDSLKLANALTSTEGTLKNRLLRLAQSEKKLETEYRSDILKKIGEGKLNPLSFEAGKFVDMVYSSPNVGPEHMAKLMAELADTPDIQQALKQKVIERVFFDAQRLVKSVDASRLGIGEPLRPANSSALERAFGTDDQRKKLEVIIGPKAMNDIAQLGKLLRSSEISESSFASMGTLASGAFIAGMIKEGPLAYSVEWLKQKFAAILISTPALKQYAQNLWATKTPFRQIFSDNTAIAVIGSVPFQQALIREYGTKGANEITQTYLNGIEQYREKSSGGTETPEQRQKRFEQLMER